MINTIKDFPALVREVYPGKKLRYLDSAATSQKPSVVIQKMDDFYKKNNANIHRGIHKLAEESTEIYESARKKIARFISVHSSKEIVFTRNTTESINLVAQTWGRKNLKKTDTIILTEMEHHSNLVPWYMLSDEIGFKIEFVSVNEDGSLSMDHFHKLLELQPKLVSFMQMSNVLGTINPVKEMIQSAHQVNAVTLVDGAQSVPHFPVDVSDLDADFLAFSAHKMCGPTGIGVLYGKRDLLESMPPYMGGGDMIKQVGLGNFTPNDLPHKFEAGTPAIAEAAGFGAAIDYLESIGMDNIHQHEREITQYAMESMLGLKGLTILGSKTNPRGGVISFMLEGIHPHDIASIVDREGIALRAGHHCAMPLHKKFNIPASTRVSFYLYTEKQDIDQLILALEKTIRYFN